VSEEQLHCVNHPQRETALRCGKCERPMCIDCLVHTPVGLRCRQCANIKRLPIYDVAPGRLLLAAAAGLAVGVIGGAVFFAVVGAFALWLSPFFGLAIGEVVSVAANRKRGPSLQVVTVAAIVVGAILGKYGPTLLLFSARTGGVGLPLAAVVDAVGRDIWLMLFVVVAAVVGLSRVR